MNRPIAFVLLLLGLCAFPFAMPLGAQSPEQLLHEEWKKLRADRPIERLPVRLSLSVSDKPEVNAWSIPKTGNIYVTRALLTVVGRNEGELRFVLGHEMGHVFLYWWNLIFPNAIQTRVALGNLFPLANPSPNWEQDRKNRDSQIEETLADGFALLSLQESGYNPYDAGAFFGRLQMLQGTTDAAARAWQPYLRDHPFNERRIEMMRSALSLQQMDNKNTPEVRRPSESVPPKYLWFGRFAVFFETVDGQRTMAGTIESLGLCTEEDFRFRETMEVEARKRLIRDSALQRNKQIVRVLDVELDGIERQVFKEEAGREQWPPRAGLGKAE